LVLRADSAYYGHDVIAAVLRHRCRFSVTARQDSAVRKAIASIDDGAWTTINYTDAVFDEAQQRWISDAQVAEITYTAFTSKPKASRFTARLIVRRVKDMNPDHQSELFTAYRYQLGQPTARRTPPDQPTVRQDSTARDAHQPASRPPRHALTPLEATSPTLHDRRSPSGGSGPERQRCSDGFLLVDVPSARVKSPAFGTPVVGSARKWGFRAQSTQQVVHQGSGEVLSEGQGRDEQAVVAGAPELVDGDLQLDVGSQLPARLRAPHCLDGELAPWLDVVDKERLGQVRVGLGLADEFS